jgi:hypothetical protein
VKAPQPSTIRLVTTARTGKPPRPPFGIRAWTPDAPGAAVLLDAGPLNGDGIDAVARQLPLASTMTPGAPVVVFGAAVTTSGVWGKLLGGGRRPIDRATRCGALIARGYIDIGAGVDPATKTELAWGRVPDDVS